MHVVHVEQVELSVDHWQILCSQTEPVLAVVESDLLVSYLFGGGDADTLVVSQLQDSHEQDLQIVQVHFLTGVVFEDAPEVVEKDSLVGV